MGLSMLDAFAHCMSVGGCM